MNVAVMKRRKSEPVAETEVITPELAQQYLDTNTNNRTVRKGKVDQFSRDMSGGRWRFTPQGIIFSSAGVLIDGQHRLLAIIQSGCSLMMWVFRGVDADVMEVIDTGATRSLKDRAQISGRFGNVTSEHTATIKKMLSGMLTDGNLTITEEMKKLEEHWAAVDFACCELKYKMPGVANASTRAVVGRAFYSIEHEVLRHFCRVLGTGEMENKDDAVILLLIRFLISQPSHGRTIRNEKYRKTERALDAWLTGEKLLKLFPTSFELFPLPEEDAERT